MPKSLLVLLLLFIVRPAFSQLGGASGLRLTIVDSTTLKGIAGATVTINKLYHLPTNNSGNVYIDKTRLAGKVSIVASCVGYKADTIRITNKKLPDTIRLTANTLSLEDVNINGTESKIHIGNLQTIYKGAYLPGPNEQLAKYIPNNEKIRGVVSALQFRINNRHKGIEMPFRVRLYTKADSSLFPGKEITTDSIIIYDRDKQTLVNVDISKYHFELPENGFFVVFETMSASWYGKEIVVDHGLRCARVPCMDENPSDTFNDPNYIPAKDTSYCLLNSKADEEDPDWEMLDPDINFGMGAVVVPE